LVLPYGIKINTNNFDPEIFQLHIHRELV